MRVHGNCLCEAPEMRACRILLADEGDDEEDEEDEEEEHRHNDQEEEDEEEEEESGLAKPSASMPIRGMDTKSREVRS